MFLWLWLNVQQVQAASLQIQHMNASLLAEEIEALNQIELSEWEDIRSLGEDKGNVILR